MLNLTFLYIKKCTLPNGKKGYKFGSKGKCYANRNDAVKQGQAIKSQSSLLQQVWNKLRKKE